jgi:hypothetical protein
MLHRIQQLGIDPRQPRQRLRIQTIVFFAAFPDQPDFASIRHDYFVPQLREQATDPGRMGPDFQRDPALRHRAKHFAQGFRGRTHSLLQLYVVRFIHHAVPTVAISQIQSNGQFLPRNIPALLCRCAANLFHCRSPLICAFKHVDTLGACSIPPETGLLPHPICLRQSRYQCSRSELLHLRLPHVVLKVLALSCYSPHTADSSSTCGSR